MSEPFFVFPQETLDPSVVIEARGPGWVIYRSTVKRERWIIYGTCNQCGECEVGAHSPHIIWTGKPIGQPGACFDRSFPTRKDSPVRPEGPNQDWPHCSLSGEYLAH